MSWSHWWKVLIGVGVGGYIFKEANVRSKTFRKALDRLTLKLPVIGPIKNSSFYARFSRTLATTFSAGVPLVHALDSVAGATGNIVYSTATQKIKNSATTGQQLSVAIKNTTLFPVMITQMVGIDEGASALDSMLDKCAIYCETEVDNAVDGLTALMKPMIMAVLSLPVGGLMIAMYLPIFQLGAVM